MYRLPVRATEKLIEFLLILAMAFTQSANAQNLLENPNFDSYPFDYWRLDPDSFWTQRQNHSENSLSGSIAIQSSDPSMIAQCVQGLYPSTRYILSAWTKVLVNENTCPWMSYALVVEWWAGDQCDGGTKPINWISTSKGSDADTWSEFTMASADREFTISPAGTKSAKVEIAGACPHGGNAGTLYVDDVSFVADVIFTNNFEPDNHL